MLAQPHGHPDGSAGRPALTKRVRRLRRGTYGHITDAPGAYPATISVSDGTNPPQVVPLTVNVTQENATPTYTGPTSMTAPPGNDTANLDLTATVVQAADGTLGDLATATATFTDTTTSETCCTSPVSSGGAASCAYAADSPRTYAVRVTVGGRYTGVTASDTTLTISTPAGTNGLQVTPPTSPVSGQYSVTAHVCRSRRRRIDAALTLTATPGGLRRRGWPDRSQRPSRGDLDGGGNVTAAPASSYPATILMADGTESEPVNSHGQRDPGERDADLHGTDHRGHRSGCPDRRRGADRPPWPRPRTATSVT